MRERRDQLGDKYLSVEIMSLGYHHRCAVGDVCTALPAQCAIMSMPGAMCRVGGRFHRGLLVGCGWFELRREGQCERPSRPA